MKPFEIKNILIPVDFSATSMLALEHATFMAKLYKANITLLHVLETYTYKVELYNFQPYAADSEKFVESLKEKLNELAEKLTSEIGSRVNVVIKNGKMASSVFEVSNEIKADLVVLGTHGAKGIEEFFIGSNAFRVVTESTVPVISVQSHNKKLGYDKLFLPIDNSVSSRQKINHALTIAKKYNSKIHLCGLISDDTDEGQQKVFSVKVKQAADFLTKNGVSVTLEIKVSDNFAKTTLKEAKAQSADMTLIMKGSDAEDNFTSIFLDRYAQQIVNHSKIPVMSITPSDLLENVSDNMFNWG